MDWSDNKQEGMNYTCVIFVAFIGLGPLFWYFYGIKNYRGPYAEGEGAPALEYESEFSDQKSAIRAS